MCGSPAKLDATGAVECYGYAWQTLYIECTKVNDEHCGMELSVNCDPHYILSDNDILIDCWNRMASK